MPPRGQNSQIIVVDVGPKMHGHLGSVAQALSGHLVSKMCNSPHHQVGLILYGTTGTRNSVHMLVVDDKEQYRCIEEAWGLQVPTKEHIQQLNSLPRGKGRTDVCEALVVAIHMYENSKAAQAKSKGSSASVLLISNLLSEAAELDQEYLGMLAERMRGSMLSLEVICPAGEKGPLPHNVATVDHLLSELGGPSMRRPRGTADLVACFTAKEVAPTTIYRGPMTFTPDLHIPVWVYKKTAEAKLPLTKQFSDSLPLDDPEATHEVKRDVIYKDPADHSREVPAEERVRAYPYGKQMVPIDATQEGYVKFKADKGFSIIGFVPRDQVPRHHYMQETNVVTPEAGNEKAAVAMAALVKAMALRDEVAIARAVWRNGATAVVMGVLTPHLGNLLHADCLLFNILPFMEDARLISCPTFDNKKVRPTKEQYNAAEKLIRNMSLEKGCGNPLSPETVANPTLAYFHQVLADRLRDVETGGVEEKLETMLKPPAQFISCPELQEAGEVLSKWITHTARPAEEKSSMQSPGGSAPMAGRDAQDLLPEESKPRVVGTVTPIEDFREIMKDTASQDAALDGLQSAILCLVRDSIGSRFHKTAFLCTQELRSVCVRMNTSASSARFNGFLISVRDMCQQNATHQLFWNLLVDAFVTLITSAEVPACTTTQEEADRLLQPTSHKEEERSPQEPNADQVGSEVKAEPVDEFDDMD